MKLKSKLILIGVVGSLIIGIGFFAASANSNFYGEPKTQLQNQPVDALNYLKNYAGKDNTGQTLFQTIIQVTSVNGLVLEEPTWEVSYTQDAFSTEYPITVSAKTSDGVKKYEFVVDLANKSVFAKNELATDILKLIN